MSSAGLPRESISNLLSVIAASGHGHDAVNNWLQDRLLAETEDQQTLSPILSDIAVRIASLLVALIGVFDEIDAAVQFILMPHRELQDRAPVQAVFTPEGVKAVDEIVRRGQHGISV